MNLKVCLSVAALLLLAACGGGSGSGSSAAAPPPGVSVPAPTQLIITLGSSPDQIALQWATPAALPDGYNLEARIGTGAFAQINGALIPANANGLAIAFAPSAPDCTRYAFRLQAVLGSQDSPYSNEAVYDRGPNAPGQATATYNWSAGTVELAWDPNTTASDGLLMERAECSQTGTLVGAWIALATPTPLASTYVDSGLSSNIYYSYRATNLYQGRPGQPGAPSLPVFTGVGAATWMTASYDSALEGVQLYWGSFSSTTPDRVVLERSDGDINGTLSGNWVEITLPAGFRTSFLDSTPTEGGRNFYRVTYQYGPQATTPYQLTHPVSVPLRAPINLQVLATAGGLQLSWTNRSVVANQVVVRRTPSPGSSSDVAILSPSLSLYLDPVIDLGYYSYAVVAKNGSGETVSLAAAAGTLNPPGALALNVTPLNLPSAADAALRPGGTWAFATTVPFGILSHNDPWPATFPASAWASERSLVQVDRQGWPHLVYANRPSASGGPSTLTHLWFDGTAWNSEPVATATIPTTSTTQGWCYRLDSTGTPHLLLDHVTADQPYGGTTHSLSYVHKVDGIWVEEPLTSLSPANSNIGTFHLSLDDSDRPHILLGGGSSVEDYVRTGPQTWSATTVPVGSVAAGWYDFLDSLWVDGDNGWIFYQDYAGPGTSLNVVQMKNGVWQPARILEPWAFVNSNIAARCAISPDRSRVAVLAATSLGFKVYHQVPDGWQATLVAPNASGILSSMRLGFDSQQKVHVLLDSGNGYTDSHE